MSGSGFDAVGLPGGSLPHFEVVGEPAAPIAVNFDRQPHLVEALPEVAANRLWQLRDATEREHGAIPAFERRAEANGDRARTEQRLDRLLAHPNVGGFGLPPDDSRVLAARRDLDRLTAEVKRVGRTYEETTSQWRKASALLAHIERSLRDRPGGTVLVAYDGPQFKVGKEPLPDQIAKLRRRIAQLKGEIGAAARAPYPAAHCKAQMRAQVDALCARGAPDLTQLVQFDGKIGWPMLNLQTRIMNVDAPPAIGFAEAPDLALAVWANRDQIISRLDGEIDRKADDKAALSPAGRERRIADLQRQLLDDAERPEAHLVHLAREQGQPVEHRSDVNYLAFLGLMLVTTPAAVQSPGTSRQHAFDVVGR